MHIKKGIGDWVFDIFNLILMVFLMIITLYPFLHVFFASISDPAAVVQHRGLLLKPIGFTTGAYKLVFKNPMIPIGYKNTLIYVTVGTAINIFLTTLGAYGLSRKNVYFKNHIMFLITFTMFFSGGLIPTYLLVKNLGMADTRWALLIPNAISAYNLIIMRTSFEGIPVSLEESAKLDGANDFTVLFKIILPLSMPVVAVMILFYGVNHWNSWFNAMIYLRDRSLFPLQLVLRGILISNSTEAMTAGATTGADIEQVGETVKYATIIVATVPILFVYPFLQKYFVKGVMIGAIKE